MTLTTIADEARLAAGNVAGLARELWRPTLRLGVTGLSRAGKTVFITALVHNLLHGGRLPLLDVVAEGRLRRAWLEPQPDDDVPRFDYEAHIAALTGPDRHWPESTRWISELRLTVAYRPVGFVKRNFGRGTVHIDIVDYPGEWLLELALLDQDYATWSQRTIAAAESPSRSHFAQPLLDLVAALDPDAPADEQAVIHAAEIFTRFLDDSRSDAEGPGTLPPGRFLMPGELEGSPLLTFAPLKLADGARARRGTLHAMMERRYEAYKSRVVKPFFRDHFARLDRQIVLVDALDALNRGPEAVRDLKEALTGILGAFRPGRNTWLSTILGRRIDRILFAATKADHLHHTSHDRLKDVLAYLVGGAMERAQFAGADVSVTALASVRATREAMVTRNGEVLPCILGVPVAGERVGNETFSGEEEIAVFPGDLPEDPRRALAEAGSGRGDDEYRFVRFRPPRVDGTGGDAPPPLPHIRLDAALNLLLGDQFE